MVLFIMLYKVALTFESVDEILKCNCQMKANLAVLSGLWRRSFTVNGVSNFRVCGCNSELKFDLSNEDSCAVPYFTVNG